MNHLQKQIGSRYESAAELVDQVKAALSLNLSHACIQHKTARSELLLKLSLNAQIELELSQSESVDEEIPSPDSCQLRRQTLLEQYLKIPNEAVQTIWSETSRGFDEGLAIIEALDSFQMSFLELLRTDFRNQIMSLAIIKYRLLSRWHSLILDSEAVGKYGPLMRDRLASITMKFHEYNERILRLERAPTFMVSDALQYLNNAVENQNLTEHTEYFYIKLRWLCREKQAELESNVDTILSNSEFQESNTSMFLHREDRAIDNELRLVLAQLRLPSSLDLSNAHRLVGEIRSHIETVFRQIADQNCRTDGQDDEVGASRPILRNATWLDDLNKRFIIAPSYEDAVQSRLLRAVASVDKVLLFESLSIEQQLDICTLETRAEDQAKAAIYLLNQDHAIASSQDSNIINEIPSKQKLQALFMARSALACKFEQQILHRVNILRSIQRRLVIDADGGLAMEDPLQLYRHKSGLEVHDSVSAGRFRPSDFLFNLNDFMKFEGIHHRDDNYENSDEDEDEFRVKDSHDIEIIYDVAFDDWKALKKRLLMMATFFVMKVDATAADKQCGFESDAQYSDLSRSSVRCDRLSILLDLYRCELDFQSAKCRLVFALLEAYEHAVDKNALKSIAERIIHTINARPRIDLTEVYFKSHYRLDTQIVYLEAEIIRDITHFQIDLQMKEMAFSEDLRPLFPYGRPVSLFGLCTSTSTIANCLNSIRDCVANYEDIWRRGHPHASLSPGYCTQAIQIAVLSAIRDSWKQHSAAFRHAMFPLSPFMEALRFDPLYTDVGKLSNRLEAIVQMTAQEGENRLINEQHVYVSYFRVFLARSQLLRCQFESDLLSSIAVHQVREILRSDDVPNVVGVRPGYTVAQAMGFPVEVMHSVCNKNMFMEASSNGFLSIVSLQKIFCSALRFLVEYHGSLGQTNSALLKFDPSLFPSSRLISHGSLLSLGDMTSSVLERVRWKTSELARLARSKTESYTDAISCQPDFLAGCLRTGLQANGFLLDIITSCERLAANTDCLIPLGSSPFNTISSPKSDPKPGELFPHWLFDLTRGVCLFRDMIIRNTLPSDITYEDIEREAKIYPILYRLCQSATSAQRLMGSSTDNASVFRNGLGSDFIMAVFEDVNANLFSTGTDKFVALSRSHTLEVVQHCLQNLHGALRLFSRNRADGIIQPLVDPDSNNAVQHLSLHLSVNNKDVEEEVELHLKRIFYRLNQITPHANRKQFADAAETIAKLYDLVFTLRKCIPMNRDLSWVNVFKHVLPAESCLETRQAFAEIMKQGMLGSQRLSQRRPDAFAVFGEEQSHFEVVTMQSNTSVANDIFSTSIVFYLLSQDIAELDRLQKSLQAAVLLEMESLDVIEIRLKAQSNWDPTQISKLPELLPLREFINQLSLSSTDFVPHSNQESDDPKQRKKDFWLIAKNDLYLHLTRLGRSIVLNNRRMLSDLERTCGATQSALEQRVLILERQKKKGEHELQQQQAKAEWSINRGIIDSQFAVVLELERLRNRESRVKQRINAMEKTIREQVEREFQREIASLKAQLLMKESRFVQYKSELKKQVSSGITDVRRQAMMGIVDSKRVPFQTKRQALQEIRDFTEESIAEQDQVDMQRTMIRMKTLFEMKELTLHSRLEAQIRKAQEKSDEANNLFESLEQSKQREKILLDQLIDEKNSVKLSRDALHQLKHELEGCQRDRRNLLEWKAKSERQMAALKSDVEKYGELKSIDVNALVSRLRKSEDALMRLAAEKSTKVSQDETQNMLNKRIKQLEHALAAEQKTKGDAIAQVLSLRNRITELQDHLLESNNQIEATASELEKERRLNFDLIKESSGLRCLPFYAAGERSRKTDSDRRQLRPQTSFVKKRAAVPALQIAAKHAVLTARSQSSTKSRNN